MDQIVLINNVFDAELSIDIGRRPLDAEGYDSAYRVDGRDGLVLAMEEFKAIADLRQQSLWR